MRLLFLTYYIALFLVGNSGLVKAQETKSFDEGIPSQDSLLNARGQSISQFYIQLNQATPPKSSEVADVIDLDYELKFVDNYLSTEEQKEYYNNLGRTISPVMKCFREIKTKLQYGKQTGPGKPPRFSIIPSQNDPNKLIASFMKKGGALEIEFEFYSHPFTTIKNIILSNGISAFELIEKRKKTVKD